MLNELRGRSTYPTQKSEMENIWSVLKPAKAHPPKLEVCLCAIQALAKGWPSRRVAEGRRDKDRFVRRHFLEDPEASMAA